MCRGQPRAATGLEAVEAARERARNGEGSDALPRSWRLVPDVALAQAAARGPLP